MAEKDYSEDLLIQAPTADLLEQQLDWESVFAQDEGAKGGWGPDSLLGRASDTEVVLTQDVLAALKRLNPGLPDAAYQDALALVVQDDITQSLIVQDARPDCGQVARESRPAGGICGCGRNHVCSQG